MTATSHLIIGSAIGAATGNLFAAFFAGVAGHFVCDLLPHVDAAIVDENGDAENITEGLDHSFTAYALAGLDIILGLIITIFIVLNSESKLMWPIIWGALGGLSIDIIDNVPFWSEFVRKLPFFKSLHNLHEGLHNVGKQYKKSHRSIGIWTQVILIALSLFYLLKKLI